MKSQLGDLGALKESVPSCGSAAVVTADSVGALHPGYSLSRVAALCPRGLPLWDLGDEAIPAPALIVQFGPTRFELVFEDTLPASQLVSIVARDSTARTLAGVGPGSPFTALTAAYGKPLLEEGECSLHVAFASQPGLSFRLDTHKQLDCAEIPGIATRNDVARLPRSTRVEEVTVYHRAPDA